LTGVNARTILKKDVLTGVNAPKFKGFDFQMTFKKYPKLKGFDFQMTFKFKDFHFQMTFKGFDSWDDSTVPNFKFEFQGPNFKFQV